MLRITYTISGVCVDFQEISVLILCNLVVYVDFQNMLKYRVEFLQKYRRERRDSAFFAYSAVNCHNLLSMYDFHTRFGHVPVLT